MTKLLISLTTISLFTTAQAATIIESWNFDDGTAGGSLNTARSSVTTTLGLGDNALTSISTPTGTAEVTHDGSTNSFFTNKTLSSGAVTTGKYQISWDVVSANFTNTAAADGKGQMGFGIRDNNGTSGQTNDVALFQFNATGGNNVFRIDGTNIQSTAEGGSKTDGAIIANLNIRTLYDLDNDNVEIYYTLGAGSEQLLKTRNITTGMDFEQLRVQVQTTNGGNSWATGDTVTFDNLVITQVPEPSSTALLGLGGLALILRRSK